MTPMIRPLAALALLALALPMALPAGAQLANPQLGGFGTQVKLGDVDYTPLLKRTALAVRAVEGEFGDPASVLDNCILLVNDFGDGGPARVAGVGPVPAVGAVGFPIYVKDIRATPCHGMASGTLIGDADVEEKGGAWTERAVEVRYVDMDKNSKFSKGDLVYLTTTGAAPNVAVGTTGLTPTTVAGSWTIRLTPTPTHAAGTFVVAGDDDFQMYGALATGVMPAAARPKSLPTSLEEREGNAFYIVPVAVPAAGTFPGGAIPTPTVPLNSIRVGVNAVMTSQPGVVPLQVRVAPGPVVAGGVILVTVQVGNTGAQAAFGVLEAKMGGHVLDVKGTPVVAPGETASVLMSLTLPSDLSGAYSLAVNDAFTAVSVTPTAKTGSTLHEAALLKEVQDLTARVSLLEHPSAVAAQVQAPAPSGSWLASAVLLVGALLVVVVRRTTP
ncbi:MAG: hypothetical protein ACYDBQ_05250 [Thermoplasmatota archaeon]